MRKFQALITPEILLRIVRIMQQNPYNIYMAKDFNMNCHKSQHYFNTLIKLDIIEPAFISYKIRDDIRINKNTKGYRLK